MSQVRKILYFGRYWVLALFTSYYLHLISQQSWTTFTARPNHIRTTVLY